MKRPVLTIGMLVAAVLVGLSPLVVSTQTFANGQTAGYCVSGPGATNGLGSCKGYFTGDKLDTYDNSGNGHVYNLITGGLAYNSASAFKSAIAGYVNQSMNNGISQNQLGASFLVEEMMGHYGPVGGGAPRKTGVQRAQNDLAAWESLVDEYASGAHAGYSIDWSRSTTVNVNSAYFGLGDDDGYHTDTNDTINAIAFIYPGGMFRIQRSCGNLVGDAAPPAPPSGWGKMVANSVATDSNGTVLSNGSSTGSIAAGRTIYWTHTVEDNKNVGTSPTPTITGDIVWGGNTALNGTIESNNTYSRSFTGNNDPVTRNRSRNTTNPGDIGHSFCQSINGNHTSSNDSSSFSSQKACVLVVAPPKITPGTSMNPNPVGVGQGYTAKATLTNSQGIAGDATATWRTWLDNGDQIYGGGDAIKNTLTKTMTVSPGTNTFGTYSDTADGTHQYVCTELLISAVGDGVVVSPGNENPPPAGYLAADKTCSPIVARPYFTVLGGDVAAGAGFGTAGVPGAAIIGTNDDNNGYPDFNGASAQLAALALGNITSFTTSQNPNGGVGPAWTNSLAGGYVPSALGFINSPAPAVPTYGGSFGNTNWQVQDYLTTPATTPFVGSSLTGVAAGNYTHSGMTLTGGSIATDGRKIVLKVTGDVYISGNITYGVSATSAVASADQIPQFELIVSGNIYVAPGVSELDGIYVAQGNGSTTGRFVSCATAAGPIIAVPGTEAVTIAACNQPTLIVNGAVAAQKVILNRTYGDVNGSGGPLPKAPGETIRFSPLLWVPSTKSNNGPGGWQSVTSLPPIL